MSEQPRLGSVTWVECPRDAWQGLERIIPVERKRAHLAALLRAGFRHLDLGSFVSPRAVPQLVRRRLVQRMLVRIEHPQLRDRVQEDFLGHEPASVIQAAEALTRFSSHDWIGSVDVPAAVVITTLDELVPPTRQRKLAASIPGAQVFEVAGDHDACVTEPAFATALVAACRAVAAARSR